MIRGWGTGLPAIRRRFRHTVRRVTVLQAVLLIGAGVAAGFANTLAGGGSILTVPALMLLGLPGDVANGTSRVSIVAQCLTGTIGYARGGKLDVRAAWRVVPLTVVGGLGGAYVATILPNTYFELLLLGTMILVALTLVVRPRTVAPPPGEERPPDAKAAVALVVAGFYGGLLQAGVGFVLLAILGSMLRYDLVRGNGLKVLAVLVFTAAALPVFILQDKIVWVPALVLTIGNVTGAWLAVRFALRRGERAVRYVLFLTVLAVIAAVVARRM